VVASIGRTPRFRRVVSARELDEAFTPTADEVAWAAARTTSDQHRLALLVLLKGYQRLGYFPNLLSVPVEVIVHVRGHAGVGAVASTPQRPVPQSLPSQAEFRLKSGAACHFGRNPSDGSSYGC
jgi:hypothetical protein